MRNVAVLSVAGLATLSLAGACHHHHAEARHAHLADQDRDADEANDERQSPELGSGLSTGSAVRSIARARCDRERRCENIGNDKKYVSEGACEEKIRADWSGDLNKYECPQGVVHAKLEECLSEVRSEDCGNPFDTLARMTQCNASDICAGD